MAVVAPTIPGRLEIDHPPCAASQLTWLIATVVAVALGLGNVTLVGAKVIAPGDGLALGAGEVTPTCIHPDCPVPPILVTQTWACPAKLGVKRKEPVPPDVEKPDTATIPDGVGEGVLNVPAKLLSEIAMVVGEAVALRNW